MKYRPIGEQVLVKPDETGNETAGGIFLPDDAKKRPETGRVVAVGGKAVSAPTLEPGQRILFDINAGVDVEHEGATHTLMPVKEVYAILD